MGGLMGAYPWGGHRNGLIPLSEMALFRGCLGRADAVRQAYALQAAYMKAFPGRQLVVLEVYRDLARQKKLRNLYLTGHGNPAAVPGSSIHGWGLAFDFAAPLNSFGSAEHRWMRENAHLYGFDNARGKADGEAWHWEYGNVPVTNWAALDIEEIDDMPSAEEVAKATVQELRNAVWFNGDAGGATDRFEAMIGKIRASVLKQEGAQVGYGTRVENIESLVTEVRELAAQTKLGINNTEDKVNFLGKVEFSAAEIAQLGSILAANVSKASDEELQRQAAAVADELKKRLAA